MAKNRSKFVRISFAVILSIGSIVNVQAQVEPGSLDYYNYVPVFGGQSVYGSARMQGLAGSGVSLGGDIGQIGLNPASLGLFRTSEASISIGVGNTGNKSSYLDRSSIGANRTWFGLPNFGVVLNFSKDDIVPGAFRGGSLGISFTKVNNYQEQFQFGGDNTKNSMTDFFAEHANASGRSLADIQSEDPNMPNSLDALAYYGYLIDYDSASNQYYAGIGFGNSANGTYDRGDPLYDFSTEKARQRGTVTRKAGQYSWDIAYGANINDRVYLGLGGSILITNYQQNVQFKEQNVPGPSGTFELFDFTYTENDNHRGTGFVAKIGTIVKVTDWMRLGGSFHTPTYNYMTQTYNWSIVANYNNVLLNDSGDRLNHSDVQTTTNSFNYRFVKPMRASVGLTLLAGKRGFITGDLEYVPYRSSSLKYPSDAFLFAATNTTISNIYNNVFNYKLGAEAKLTKEFSLRGGFAYYADPYNHFDDVKRDQYNFSFGGGYRIEGFYVDFAVVQSYTNQRYKPYTLSNGQEPTADIKKHYGFYQVTTGFTF